MKKKVIIIIAVVCVAIIAVVGTIFGVNAYNNYTIQQQTEQQVKSIDDTYSKFTKETDRAKKSVILSDFIKNKPSTSDEIKVEVLHSVEPKYNETLAKMQKFFTDDYDKTIKDNTIDSKTLEKTNDKKKLQSCIDNLEALKKTIDSEKSNVFYKKDIGNYDKKPDELISSYNDRITAIEKLKQKQRLRKRPRQKRKPKKKLNRKRRSKPRAVTQITPITPTVIIQTVTATAETATTAETIITVLTIVTTAVEIIITMIQAIHHQAHPRSIMIAGMKMKMAKVITMKALEKHGMIMVTVGIIKIFGKVQINNYILIFLFYF